MNAFILSILSAGQSEAAMGANMRGRTEVPDAAVAEAVHQGGSQGHFG